VELQFSQALTAAEVLGALARQSGIGTSNFQTAALELFASRPGLASLELQPGGVVSDIVPRAGNERAIGFNVLKDEGQRPGAYATIQRRVLTVTGPFETLSRRAGHRGEGAGFPTGARWPRLLLGLCCRLNAAAGGLGSGRGL
jgi:sensor domain CHASE-containing protein